MVFRTRSFGFSCARATQIVKGATVVGCYKSSDGNIRSMFGPSNQKNACMFIIDSLFEAPSNNIGKLVDLRGLRRKSCGASGAEMVVATRGGQTKEMQGKWSRRCMCACAIKTYEHGKRKARAIRR
jgi:hypothetical protein